MSLYYLPHARFADQRQRMAELEAEGVCIFCPPHGTDPSDPTVLQVFDHWVVRRNAYPYRNTKLHLMLVPTSHVTDLADLPDTEHSGLWTALRWVREKYDLNFYGLAVRCGECSATGATIAHIHLHLIVGDVDDPEHPGSKFRLSAAKVTEQG